MPLLTFRNPLISVINAMISLGFEGVGFHNHLVNEYTQFFNIKLSVTTTNRPWSYFCDRKTLSVYRCAEFCHGTGSTTT